MTHIRIERADNEGHKRLVNYDHIYVVADDGTEVDISALTKGWQLNAKVGEVETATLYMMGVRVVENPALLPAIDEKALV